MPRGPKSAKTGKFNADAFSGALEELRLVVCGILAGLREATFDEPLTADVVVSVVAEAASGYRAESGARTPRTMP
jgi:hypothetical protein